MKKMKPEVRMLSSETLECHGKDQCACIETCYILIQARDSETLPVYERWKNADLWPSFV
jgi:hypothetical protein